jgi:hypothetical protein
VAPLTANGTYRFGAAPVSDTAFYVRVPNPNPRGEYFLLENRQALLADTAMIAKHGGGGLLIWHVDSAQYALGLPSNRVNNGPIHGLALMEAAGDTGLNCEYPAACNDRGDAGDPYPGSSGNTVFGPSSRPAARMNGSGGFAGFVVDSIGQLAPNGAMTFRVTFGAMTVVGASDTAAQVTVDGAPINVYRNVWTAGSTHTIAADSTQLAPGGTAQFLFTAWSDGGARTHAVAGSASGASYTALMAVRYLARYRVAGGGAVAASRALDPAAGAFLAAGDSVTLTAAAAAGQVFLGWSGDTTASSAALGLRMTRPFTVTANFAAPADVVSQLLSGAPALSATARQVLDRLGNDNGRLDLGDLVAWLDREPGLATSPPMAKLLRSLHR